MGARVRLEPAQGRGGRRRPLGARQRWVGAAPRGAAEGATCAAARALLRACSRGRWEPLRRGLSEASVAASACGRALSGLRAAPHRRGGSCGACQHAGTAPHDDGMSRRATACGACGYVVWKPAPGLVSRALAEVGAQPSGAREILALRAHACWATKVDSSESWRSRSALARLARAVGPCRLARATRLGYAPAALVRDQRLLVCRGGRIGGLQSASEPQRYSPRGSPVQPIGSTFRFLFGGQSSSGTCRSFGRAGTDPHGSVGLKPGDPRVPRTPPLSCERGPPPLVGP